MEKTDSYGSVEMSEEWSLAESKKSSKQDVIGSPRKSFDISSTSISRAKSHSNKPLPRLLFSQQKKIRQGKAQTSVVRKDLYASWVESKPWGIFITVVTLYALFGDDLRLLAFTKFNTQFKFCLQNQSSHIHGQSYFMNATRIL